MTARIVLIEEHRAALQRCLFDVPGVEGAAFVLCGQAVVDSTTKLIGHSVVPIAAEDFLRRERDGLSINSRALVRVTKLARYEGLSIVFAHSHPGGFPHFSDQDDDEEERLLPFLQARVPGRLHGTIVMTEAGFAGRVYAPDRAPAEVLVIGERFRLYGDHAGEPVPLVFDRQVRAFGPDIQRILRSLHVGIVGVGGTGSPVAEQLYRLGVGKLTLFDGDTFEDTNVNRVYGSSLEDVDAPKVVIAKRHLDRIGLPTHVESVIGDITDEAIARRLPACDVVFGCTDKQIPRAILMQLALRYCLLVLDLGVLIDSEDQRITGIHGRVTTQLPGEACLFCRGRISSEAMRIEALPPEERAQQVREGYAPELDGPAPAVIAFTSAVASFAVIEFLHRLTGFMGEERASSELLIAFDQSRLRTNRVAPREACQCSDLAGWGRGDESPFLGMAWATRSRSM